MSLEEVPSWSRRASGRIGLIAVAIAVTTLANLIMVPMPKPLAEYDLSPVLIYAFGVLMRPVDSMVVIAVAQGIGTTIKALNLGWPLVFIPGAIFVRGIEAPLIGLIARRGHGARGVGIARREVVAMVVGVVWETVGFTVADVALFGPAMAAITLLTIVDAVFIPVAIPVVVAVRRGLRARWLT